MSFAGPSETIAPGAGREHSLMHEYSLPQALIEQVECAARAHEAVSVRRVIVRIGPRLAGGDALILERIEMEVPVHV